MKFKKIILCSFVVMGLPLRASIAEPFENMLKEKASIFPVELSATSAVSRLVYYSREPEWANNRNTCCTSTLLATDVVNGDPKNALSPGRSNKFVLNDKFDPGMMIVAAGASGCTVESPPRFSIQTNSVGTVHVDEYMFPHGCFGRTNDDAVYGVGFVIEQGGASHMAFQYRKGGRSELLQFLHTQ